MEDAEKYQDTFWREEAQEQFEQEAYDDRREMERLYNEERKIKDQFYSKRNNKESLKKTGGLKKESPVWDDE